MTATGVAAQSYPSGPVKVIVPFGAGGATDILARIFSERLQQGLGQSFTVENRGGAAGQIAAAAVARCPMTARPSCSRPRRRSPSRR